MDHDRLANARRSSFCQRSVAKVRRSCSSACNHTAECKNLVIFGMIYNCLSAMKATTLASKLMAQLELQPPSSAMSIYAGGLRLARAMSGEISEPGPTSSILRP